MTSVARLLTIEDRVAHYLSRAMPEPNSGCLLWTGALSHDGYAKAGWQHTYFYVHVFLWEAVHGPVPEGLELDHLCRVRSCVEERHLDPVTGQVNKLRGTGLVAINAAKTACIRGHPLSGENLYIWRDERHCRTCRLANHRIYVLNRGVANGESGAA